MDGIIFDVTGDWDKYEGRCILHPKFKTFQVYGGYDKAQRWKAVGAWNAKDDTGTWHAVAKNVEILVAMAKIRGPIALDPEASKRFKELHGSLVASRAETADIEIPCGEGYAFLPYQRAGIKYSLDKFNSDQLGVLIADDMGLGKSAQLIGIVNAKPEIKNVLVICPATIKITWRNEVRKFAVREWNIWYSRKNQPCPPAANWVIVNYEQMSKRPELYERSWDIVCIDECQNLRNPEAKRTKFAYGYWDKVNKTQVPGLVHKGTYKVALSGTAIVNRPVELYPTLNAIAPGKFGYWKTFVTKYCNAVRTRFGWDVKGSSNLPDLQLKLRQTCMIRRMKKDVLKELPPKTRQVVELECDSRIIEKENALWAKYQDEMDEIQAEMDLAKASGDTKTYEEQVKKLSALSKVAFTEMAIVRHEVALEKVPYVIDHIINALENVDQLVVFGWHNDVLAKIFAGLKDYNPVIITGQTDVDDRQPIVDRFQTDPSIRVFIGNIKAAGVGLTLTKATLAIFAELPWTPGDVSQAEDRIYRIGTTEPVLIQHLVLNNSFDAKLAHTIVEKQKIIDAALDNPTEIDIPVIPMPRGGWVLPSKFPKVPDELKVVVHSGLRLLARMCDGARQLDGAGFNKFDTRTGKKLAAMPDLTDGQAVLGSRLVNKYRGQIGGEEGELCKTAKLVLSLK